MPAPHVLILEDELFVAIDLESLVQRHEPAARIVICSSVAEAKTVLDAPITLALLDIDVIDGKTFEVAMILQEKGIPLAFVSGSRPDEIPPSLAAIPFIPKPFAAPIIHDALLRLSNSGVSR
jgi:response regulator of citrate/malate metabolism